MLLQKPFWWNSFNPQWMEVLMFGKLITLFILGRKVAKSDILNITSKFQKTPLLIKILFKVLSFSFSPQNLDKINKNEGERLSSSLESMGTTFIKLGQFLATRPDIIGEELSKKLENLQDKLPPFSLIQAKKIIKNDLGEDTYNSIINLSEPVAAASIAQVHKAQIDDNGTIKDVAIKILRPDIKKIFNKEIDAMMLFAFLVESFVKKSKRLKLVEVVFLLKEITNLEMDLRFEAAAANEYAENTKNDVGFRVPEIYWNFTSENVMTLDWVDGVSIRETEELKKRNLNTRKIAEDIIQNFLRHAVRDGFFHADMHQGNIFIDKNGHIVPIDFGIMGRLDKMSKRFLAEILFGFIQRDYRKVAEVHLIAGLVPKDVPIDDLSQALRSIGEPIFGQAVKDISGGKLLKQLFDVTEKFNMQTQPQLLMLQKTMVVVEGVARKLNPNTNIWTTSKPVLESWLKETKDPITTINETLQNTSEVIKRLPEFPEIMDKANQALTYLASGQIPQNSNSFTDLNSKKSEMIAFRNQSIIGLLVLVIFGLLVF
ncbi:2-polyprenylphenol 6-hydroxylase [Candidatus Pelagibacter sp.]|nr:2-polyprenylphenol 6-hydroxylase [Candidatus Pelagibacter sp.]